jgi:hypothetical protein
MCGIITRKEGFWDEEKAKLEIPDSPICLFFASNWLATSLQYQFSIARETI